MPAYKATRIIAEVVIESLPQCVLQSYIYLIVIYHDRMGTATPSEHEMLSFVQVGARPAPSASQRPLLPSLPTTP